MRSLSDTLRSFVRWNTHSEIMTLQSEFPWPPQIAKVARQFKSYTWARPLHPRDTTVFGIAELPARWPTETLQELEAAIYQPDATGVIYGNGTNRRGLDYYLIVEILDPRTVRAKLTMLVRSRDWTVLDEHTLNIK